MGSVVPALPDPWCEDFTKDFTNGFHRSAPEPRAAPGYAMMNVMRNVMTNVMTNIMLVVLINVMTTEFQNTEKYHNNNKKQNITIMHIICILYRYID